MARGATTAGMADEVIAWDLSVDIEHADDALAVAEIDAYRELRMRHGRPTVR